MQYDPPTDAEKYVNALMLYVLLACGFASLFFAAIAALVR